MKVIRKTLSSMSGISGLLAVAVCVLTLVAPVRAQEREYTTIVPPDDLGNPQLTTTASTAFGINARGDVVGTFTEGIGQNSVQHGFLLSKGEFTVIDFPGAQSTIARGINPRGDIVGSYRLLGDPPVATRGFLRTKKGEFVNVRYPDHSWEIAQRILPNGTIVHRRVSWRCGVAASIAFGAAVVMAQSSDAQLIAENTQSWSGKLPSGFNGNCEITVHSNYKVARCRLGILLK